MRDLALSAIGAYKRYLSPHKGFCCAYREHTGRASCSTLGSRAIRRHGVLRGIAILRARLARCGEAHRAHRGSHGAMAHPQRGDCDCGGCDIPGDGCDACNCGDCGNWGSELKKDQRRKSSRRAASDASR